MDILNIKDYSEARQFFFKELTPRLTFAIEASGYSIKQSLNELLKRLNKLDKSLLLCYIWKDAYSRAYVFDVNDQRKELMRTYKYAQTIVNDEELKKLYIDNHDNFVKNEHTKTKLDITTIIGD